MENAAAAVDEEAEKRVGLKKAYAKEAAFRVPVRDRKGKSLDMLLRLNQILDSKIAEAEGASLGRRRRIRELEAQLDKAEGRVRDLQVELRSVQDKVEKVKNNHLKQMDNQIVKDTKHQTHPCQEKKLYTSDPLVCPLVSGPECTSLNQKHGDDSRSCTFENGSPLTEALDSLSLEHYSAGNTDLSSVIMRSKETELYRNGCTQRIRAFEQNLFAGKLPVHGQKDDGYSHTKDELMVGEDPTMKETCSLTSPKFKTIAVKLDKSKEMVQRDSSFDNSQVVRFFRRYSSRKLRAKFDNSETTTNGSPDLLKEACQPPQVVPSPDTSSSLQDNMIEYDKNPMKLIGGEAPKDLDSHLVPISKEDNKAIEDKNHHLDTSLDSEDPKNHIAMASVQNDTGEIKLSIEELELTRNERKNSSTSDVSMCKMKLETVDVPPIDSDSNDEKPCGTSEPPSEAINDRLLKYTFRRKRKRVPLHRLIEDDCVEKKSTSKRRTQDTRRASPEPQKPTPIVELSRDSRRLVQVARQLISLSQKQWW